MKNFVFEFLVTCPLISYLLTEIVVLGVFVCLSIVLISVAL